MKPNYFILLLSEIKEYIQLRQKVGSKVDWCQVLELKDRPKVALIQVLDESGKTELASVNWRWDNEEIRFGKIFVDKSLRQQRIADTLMEMFFEIAKFYNASKITGVIDGDSFLWGWYKKLGFSVYDSNKLIMELRKS